ncbi:hypothetical protein QOT17_013891 [Balamuthia mandrillaris]
MQARNEEVETSSFSSVTYDDLASVWPWKEIRNCPGRFIIPTPRNKTQTPTGEENDPRTMTPLALLSFVLQRKANDGNAEEEKCRVYEYDLNGKDHISIIRLKEDSGALLTYHKEDGAHVHTLNTPSGIQRKMTAMHISFY